MPWRVLAVVVVVLGVVFWWISQFLQSLPVLDVVSDDFLLDEEVWWTIPQSVVAYEDRRFFSHGGVDWYGVARAASINLRQGRVVQGWSTLEQQLLKWHWGHTQRWWVEKMSEVVGALLLSLRYSKEQLLHAYLTRIPFPNGRVTGYHEACSYYFGKRCVKLFPAEVFFLVAVAQYGANPYRKDVFERVKTISVDVCRAQGACDDLLVLPPVSVYDLSWRMADLDPRTRVLLEEYPNPAFDLVLHRQVQSVLDEHRGMLDQYGIGDCCVVVLGEDGVVEAYNQCRAYDDRVGTVDMCRRPRQTGSAIKPFLYALAFERLWMSGGTMIVDEPVSYRLGNGGVYEPKNFSQRFYGEVSLAEALGSSLNIPAVKLTALLGVDRVVAFLHVLRGEYGVSPWSVLEESDVYSAEELGLSVGLGTYAMSPLEFARLWWYRYRPLGSGGSLDVQNAVKAILADPLYRVLSFGQDSLLNRSGWFVKTGTSRKFVDGWACGGREDRERVVCVRVGNHDVSSMRASSLDSAAYLWYVLTLLLDRGG
jgi:penicillin-binding protein 1C